MVDARRRECARPALSRRPALAALVVLAAVVLLGAAPGARALPGPSSLMQGISDDPVMLSISDSARSIWLDRASSVGSQGIRLETTWAQIAPYSRPRHWNESSASDSHYNWSIIDSAVEAITSHGEQPLLMVREAPIWAEQNLPAGVPFNGVWNPNPRDFGAFAHALAERYSGHFKVHGHRLPHVSWFQAWNEPNLDNYLLPQWYLNSKGQYVPASPGIYRGLLNAFYAGVKAVQPHATVLAAGTAPYGDPPPPKSVGARMYPVYFYQQLFCLSASLKPFSCGSPPHLDALDHHPYGATPRVHASQSGDIAVPDLYKINQIARAAVHYHHVMPAGPKPLWVTEIDWTSQPKYSLTRQAYYVSLGFYELWRQGVTHVFWFFLRDSIQPQRSFSQSGLFTVSGARKPSATAFRFPFVAMRTGKKQLILWGRAPHAGTVTIQKQVGRHWQTVSTLHATSGGIVYAVTKRFGRHAVLRAAMGSVASLGWPSDGNGT